VSEAVDIACRRLRQSPGIKYPIDDACDLLTSQDARIERLEDALRQIADGTYPPTRQERGDCPHGITLNEDCIDCVQDCARAALNEGEG
jgi:hypothetical protein